MVRVGRAINGISLNGLKFLLNDDGNEKYFRDKETAKVFLIINGIPEEDLEDGFVYQENIDDEWVVI